MPTRLPEEILSRIKEIFPHQIDVFGSVYPKNEFVVTVRLRAEYENSSVSFEQLSSLSELLGTRKINLGDIEKSSGCATCSYGSETTVEVFCREVQLPESKVSNKGKKRKS